MRLQHVAALVTETLCSSWFSDTEFAHVVLLGSTWKRWDDSWASCWRNEMKPELYTLSLGRDVEERIISSD